MSERPSIKTAKQFESEYAARSGQTVEQLRARGLIVVPCGPGCDDDECEGWGSVSVETWQRDVRLWLDGKGPDPTKGATWGHWDVTHFGAKQDGTDCTAAFQMAIDAASR